ncbi:MAG: AraC family transcriptional regulator [bacterium]|nr:AraC family transcriptional regulator [bacterium]
MRTQRKPADAAAPAVDVSPGYYHADFHLGCWHAPTHQNRAAHAHACAELVVIQSGTATHFTSFGMHRLTPGDVLVIGGPCYHGYRNVDHLKLMNIQFDPAEFLPADAAVQSLAGFKRMFGLATPRAQQQGFFGHARLTRDQFTRVEDLVWRLHNEAVMQQPGYQTVMRALFHELVVSVARAYRTRVIERQPHKKVARAVEFIDAHYAEDITIAQIVTASGVSPAHFHRLFRHDMGCYPNWYLRNVRVNHAAVLLRESGESITDIAMKVGFNDSNYFARAFRVAMGMTARAFRKETQRRTTAPATARH